MTQIPTPLADMVQTMLERDASRDELVTFLRAAERHAFVTRSSRLIGDTNSKSAERSRRYRERQRHVRHVTQETPPSLTKIKIKKVRGQKKPSVTLPVTFEPDWKSASSVGLSRVEAEREFLKFKNHAAQTDRHCADWQAAWRNWCIKAAEFLGKPPPKPKNHDGTAVLPPPPPGLPSNETLREKYEQQLSAVQTEAAARQNRETGSGADHSEELRPDGAEICPDLRRL